MPNPSLKMTDLDKKSDDLIHLCTLRLQFVGKTCKTLATQGLTSGKRGGISHGNGLMLFLFAKKDLSECIIMQIIEMLSTFGGSTKLAVNIPCRHSDYQKCPTLILDTASKDRHL